MAVNNEVNITLNAKDKASAEFKNVEKSAWGLWSKLKAMWWPLAAVWASIAAVWVAAWVVWVKMFNMWADMEQTIGKAKTVFGEYYWEMEKFADENAKAMWLTRNEYLKTAAWMQDLLIPMWFTRQEATKMTQETTSLAWALAEWSAWQYNAAQVWDILTAAMLWERDQLKSLWIAISAEEVSQRTLENSQKWVTFATEQQAAAFATQQLIFEKSTDAQNAYANWADSLTRKKAEMIATLWNLQNTVVSALLPAFHEIVKSIEPIITKVAENISLWFQNKENIDALIWTVKNIIWFFGVLFEIIWTVVWALYSLWEWLWFAAFKVVEFVWIAYDKFISFKNTTFEVFTSIKDFIVWIFEWMKNAIIEKFQAAIQFVTDALAKVQAVWQKVENVVWSVKNAASSVASWVWNFISGTKANGWDVKAWQAYRVWERGSELFVPNTSWTIIPNSWMGWNISINMGWVTVNNEADENRLVQKIQANLTETLQMYKFWIS